MEKVLQSLIEAAPQLAQSGPIGLAIVMVLAVAISMFVRLDAAKSRIVRLVLYLATFCFVLLWILLAIPIAFPGPGPQTYLLHVKVYPQDMLAGSHLPPAGIAINNVAMTEPINYPVKSEVFATIDVSNAVDTTTALVKSNESQQAAIKQASATWSNDLSSLAQITSLLDKSCPGGGSGVQDPHAPQIESIANSVAGHLSEARATLAAAANLNGP